MSDASFQRTLSTLILLAGCVGTEVGNPPFTPDEPSQPGFDAEQVTAAVDGPGDVRDGTIEVRIPEAALGTAGTLAVVNLDGSAAPVPLTADGAGMLRAALVTLPGHVLRVQLQGPTGRQAPVDYTVTAEFGLLRDQGSECIRVESRDRVLPAELPAILSVRVKNDCAREVLVVGRLRISDAGASLVGSEERVLGPGAVDAVDVRVELTDSPQVENHLLLTTASPAGGRVAVTVRPAD